LRKGNPLLQIVLVINSFSFVTRSLRQEVIIAKNDLNKTIIEVDSGIAILFTVLWVCVMCYFKQENKYTIHSCRSKNGKYPIKYAYVVKNKIDDSSVIGRHANGTTEYWFP